DFGVLTNLSATDYDPVSLAGLERAGNLAKLAISANRITDLSPIAALRRLTTLRVSGQAETTGFGDLIPQDLSFLRGLTNLVSLELEDRVLDNTSPLSSLTQLTTL